MKKLINKIVGRSNVLSLSGQAIFAILGFTSIVLLSRAFDKTNFGTWVLYISVINFLEMLRTGFLKTALVRFCAAEPQNENQYIGSSWVLGISVTVALSLLVWAVLLFLPEAYSDSIFYLICIWYPIYALISLPYHYGTYLLQAKEKFGSILLVKSLNMVLFIVGIVVIQINQLELPYVIIAHVISNLVASIVAVIMGWSGLQYLGSAVKATVMKLLHFGKYSVGTLIGSNLLKSSDTFLIAFFLGPNAVAIYSIPLKLTELFDILIRSFIAVALPRMSLASTKKNLNKVRAILYKYAGTLTIIYIPLLVFCFIFAEDLVVLLGGEQYASSAIIFRIFLIYGFFLPVDRFTGVTLDSINRPRLNLYKVIFMLVANVVGDVIVLTFFGELWMVAAVTITTVLTGLVMGLYLLQGEMEVKYKSFFVEGWKKCLSLKELLNRKPVSQV